MIKTKIINALIALGVATTAQATTTTSAAPVLNTQEFSDAAQVISEMMDAGLLIQDKNGDIKMNRSFKNQLLKSGRLKVLMAKDGSICH